MGKNLKFNLEMAKIGKSNIVPEKIFLFIKKHQSLSASRAITSF